MFINKINVEPELLYLILTIAVVFLVLGLNFSHTNYSFAQSDQFSQLQKASKPKQFYVFKVNFVERILHYIATLSLPNIHFHRNVKCH